MMRKKAGYGKTTKKAKSGSKVKKAGYGSKTMKAKSGSKLGMKSVKAGYDKNPSVTRADIIVAAKKKAKKGKTVKKAGYGTKAKKAKSGCSTRRKKK